jgi:hypothetical protein
LSYNGADGRDTMPSYGRRSVEGRANLQDVKNACMILNTAEYCQSTSLQVCLLNYSIVSGGTVLISSWKRDSKARSTHNTKTKSHSKQSVKHSLRKPNPLLMV